VNTLEAKSANGVSLLFLIVDISGGIASTLSLIFHPPPFDFRSFATYAAAIVLDFGIVLQGLYYGSWSFNKWMGDVNNNRLENGESSKYESDTNLNEDNLIEKT